MKYTESQPHSSSISTEGEPYQLEPQQHEPQQTESQQIETQQSKPRSTEKWESPTTETAKQNRWSDDSTAAVAEPTFDLPTEQRRNKGLRIILWLSAICVTVVGLLSVGSFFFPTMNLWPFGGNDVTNSELSFTSVKRARFRVTIVERGSLESLMNVTLYSKVDRTATIIAIVPEGTQVYGPLSAQISGTVSKIRTTKKKYEVTIQSDPVILSLWPTVIIPPRKITHKIDRHKLTVLLVKKQQRVNKESFLAGDVVCELDSAELVEKEKKQQIDVTRSNANYEKVRKDIEIQENQNQSDLDSAQLKLELARLDLTKFQKGEKIREENEQKGDVLIAQLALTQAEETYDYFQRSAKKGYKSQIELETARVAVVKAKNTLAVAQEKLLVLQNFTFIRTFKELSENVQQAKLEIKRVELTGMAALDQFRSELAAQKLKHSVEVEQFARVKEQIKACRLIAPQNGKVVYANQKSRRSADVIIEEGVGVRERQAIISLPDFSKMKVNTRLQESKIAHVRDGLPAIIKIDAFPKQTFQGVVTDVPDVPVRGEWPNTDMMIYETTIRLLNPNDKLKPNMKAEVEIIVEDREDVLQVPVQAIVAIGHSYAAFVKTNSDVELRENIRLGMSNEKMIQVISGLHENEEVVMNPRTHYAEKIRKLREAVKIPGMKPMPVTKKQRPKKPKTKRPTAASSFQRFDKNKDGKITADELPSQMKKMIDRADLNKDKAIDKQEWKKATEKPNSSQNSTGQNRGGQNRNGKRGPN